MTTRGLSHARNRREDPRAERSPDPTGAEPVSAQFPPDEAQARQQVTAFLNQQMAQQVRDRSQDEALRRGEGRDPPRSAAGQARDRRRTTPCGARRRAGGARRVHRLPVPLLRTRPADPGRGSRALWGFGGPCVQEPPASHASAGRPGRRSGALCAGDQGKFWELHDWLFANKSNISHDTLVAQAEVLRVWMFRSSRSASIPGPQRGGGCRCRRSRDLRHPRHPGLCDQRPDPHRSPAARAVHRRHRRRTQKGRATRFREPRPPRPSRSLKRNRILIREPTMNNAPGRPGAFSF